MEARCIQGLSKAVWQGRHRNTSTGHWTAKLSHKKDTSSGIQFNLGEEMCCSAWTRSDVKVCEKGSRQVRENIYGAYRTLITLSDAQVQSRRPHDDDSPVSMTAGTER